MKKLLPYLLIVAGLLVFYWYRYRHAPSLDLVKIEVTDPGTGKKVLLDESIGSNSVVHFYASWCGPCIREMKMIAAEYDNISAHGWQVICITDDDAATIELMKKTMPPQVQFYQVPSLSDLGIHSLPVTYFTDNDGQIVKKQVEPVDWQNEEFLSGVSKLLNK